MGMVPKGAVPGHLHIFCQKVLPAVFDDSLSYYEVVCKVVKILNEHGDAINSMAETLNLHTDQIAEIQKWIQDFNAGNLNPQLQAWIKQWIDENLKYIFDNTAKQVFFGLTQDGYFVAYIPESWNDIIFDTGWDYSKDTYGRLILRWNTDSVHTVNQIPQSATTKPHGAVVDDNVRPTV